MLNLLKNYNKKNKLSKKQDNLVIPQVKQGNDVGITRHFPSSTKSWHNSMYFFNRNIGRSILYLDTFVNNLIKMYFNLISNVDKDLKFMRRRNRIRNRSINKIFVSRTEINHTNDKVVITIYTYNRIKKYYLNKLSELYKDIFNVSNISNLNKTNLSESKSNSMKKLNYEDLNDLSNKALNRLYLTDYFKDLYSYNKLYVLLFKKFKDISLKYSNLFLRFLSHSDYVNKILKNKKLFHIINNVNNTKISTLLKLEKLNNIKDYEKKHYNNFIDNSLQEEITYLNYNQSLMIDANKYNNIYLSRLNTIIGNIYNKKVEFNIINLKYAHLDTHILSESINIKMRNRNNTPIRILQKVLLLPKINNSKTYNYNTQNLYKANYNDIDLNKIYYANNKDILNVVLNSIFNIKNTFYSDHFKDKYVYRSIKLRKVRGIRLEAKGRITKRLTASRSLSKSVYKGSLKNLDSSINGLSSVLLRGHLNSNIDYLNINSKTRNGAFGLKGWISSK